MNILVEHHEQIATITLNRPSKLNALDADLLEGIYQTVTEIGANHQTRCVIITGSGKAFVAGADIAAIQNMDSQAATEFSQLGKKAFHAIEQFSCPVIAAINGFALGGGCELALSCDFMIASEKAKFGLPEAKLGVIPGFGGMQRMASRVGTALTREMVYTGKIIDANEALRIGLVNQVLPVDQLLPTCQEIAEQIAAVGPLAVTAAKQTLAGPAYVIDELADQSDSQHFGSLFGTADQAEGMQAFVEKRNPEFTAK